MIVAAGAWFMLDPAFRYWRSTQTVIDALPKDVFEQRVRDYILNNPEIVMEAARRFQERQRAAEAGEPHPR